MAKHTYTPGYLNYNEFPDKPSRNLCKVEWELKDGRFTMSAEIWQQNTRDILRGGQCVDEIAKLFPNDAKLQRMCKIWERWHLNDMRAGCEHQRELPEFQPRYEPALEISVEFHAYKALEAATEKDETGPEAKLLANLQAFDVRPFHKVLMTQERADRLYAWLGGWADQTTKYAKGHNLIINKVQIPLHHTYPKDHPLGFLAKPCPMCGYKYGTKWLKEELPEDVVKEIESWSIT